jgi:hypothetical protein
MAKDKYIEVKFPIMCCGRKAGGEEVLDEPVHAEVEVHQRMGDDKNISMLVECPHNYGGHGEYCKASHPLHRRQMVKVYCPYSFDLPHYMDFRSKNG